MRFPATSVRKKQLKWMHGGNAKISKEKHQQIENAHAASRQQLRPLDSRLVNLDRLAIEVAGEISEQSRT
jgi:hypothetical protein